jgi:hypothetical protein
MKEIEVFKPYEFAHRDASLNELLRNLTDVVAVLHFFEHGRQVEY